MIAAEIESFSYLQLLIDNGADWFIKDNRGDFFIDYLSDELLVMISKDYPDKYSEYLIKKESEKYNL